jgi:hypothetical protein
VTPTNGSSGLGWNPRAGKKKFQKQGLRQIWQRSVQTNLVFISIIASSCCVFAFDHAGFGARICGFAYEKGF